MLLVALHNAFLEGGEIGRAEGIRRTYLVAHDLETDTAEPRLHLNEEDAEYFRQLVFGSSGDPLKTPENLSQKRIQSAFALLTDGVRQIVRSSGASWQRQLISWVQFIEGDLHVIRVIAPDANDAFLIFETLNDRGAPLTTADLLKNHLYQLAGPRMDAVRRSWSVAQQNLDTGDDAELYVTFLRHYWSSLRGAVRERDLYRSLRNGIGSNRQAVEFAERLEVSSGLYAALRNADHDYWNDFGSAFRPVIETLVRLGLEQNRPLLLAVMEYFTSSELRLLLRSIVGWSVRGLVTGGIGGGKTERYYSEAATKIRSGKIGTTEELFYELAPIRSRR